LEQLLEEYKNIFTWMYEDHIGTPLDLA